MLTTTRLSCELRTDPLGVDTPRPRLGWIVESAERDQRQAAYQILAAGRREDLTPERADLWDSGRVESDRTISVLYDGAALVSGQECFWTVRAWDRDGCASEWAAPGLWQMGLLFPDDWHGRWISFFAGQPHLDLTAPPFLRREFAVTKPIALATLTATARGVYVPSINGRRVGDAHFAPGWTDYRKRLAYQTYDVTSLLRQGVNALGVVLGDGWYAGYIGYAGPGARQRAHYGERTQFLAQLNIEYADGSRLSLGTDEGWKGIVGPILCSDMLMGETYDARAQMPGWDTPGYDDTDWRPVTVERALGEVPLVAQPDPPVRVTEELAPRTISEPTPGTHLFDLGQNMVGWVRLRVQGLAGTIVRLRFGEMLQPDGTLYVANLRSAKATDTYILKGEGTETWEPSFTFHGFRYVEVTGYPGTPGPDAVTGIVLHSDIPRTGTFACSDPMVNQLVSNIDWGQRGNFLSVPTDCPQRDERLGWMGDAQIFVRTAAANRDVAAFFEKWMDDVVDAQGTEGGFPDIAPRLVNESDGAPAWGDAGVIVPWTISQVYGDAHILERHYGAMAHWMDSLDSANPDGLWEHRRGNDYGDWLSIDADTPKDVLATAYFAYDASLMARIARALGKADDGVKYDALYEKVRAAFNAAFVTDDSRIQGDTQTCYVLALRFDLLPEDKRAAAARHLVDDIATHGGHLSTGFVGVGYLCPVLTEAGYNDVAYQLLLNDTFPSWGYSIKHGATTIWERWDGWTADKGFQDVGMNSFNHYSLGSVGEWLQRYVAGIDLDPDRPGFAHVLIRPHPGPGLTYARAEYQSVRGRIVSGWVKEGGGLTLDVTLPANTTATVSVPAPAHATVTEGGRPLDGGEGVTPLSRDAHAVVCRVGSGTYRFEVSP